MITEATGKVSHHLIDLVASGNVCALVSGKKRRVLSAIFRAVGATLFSFASSGDSDTQISGDIYMATNTTISLAYNPCGHFETVAGEALKITLTSGALKGTLTVQDVV